MKSITNYLIVLLFITFLSCRNDENLMLDFSQINAKIENSNDYENKTDSVYACILRADNNNDFHLEVVSRTKFQNGFFNIQLPKTLNNEQLVFSINKAFVVDSLISDTTVRVNYIDLICLNEGLKVGFLLLHNKLNSIDSGYVSCQYIYCNKPVTIKGVNKNKNGYYWYTCYYNLSLKKGWNLLSTKFRNNNIEYRTEIECNKLPNDVSWYMHSTFQ